MKIFSSPRALLDAVGETFGPTGPILVNQARINLFADATDDHQWIHVDAARAADGPFGSTVAHGFLTLSLLSAFLPDLLEVQNMAVSVNVGLDRVRFLAPVPAGAKLIATAILTSAVEKGDAIQFVLSVTISPEGGEKPACIADIVIRYYS